MNRRLFLLRSLSAPLSGAGALLAPSPTYRQPGRRVLGGPPLRTGLEDLDGLLGGGLPSVGVTLLISRYEECAEALILNMTDHHLLQDDRPVAYVSGRHTKDAVLDRLACIRTGLERFRRRRGHWSEREHSAFEGALDQVRSSKLHFEDARRLRSLSEVGASLRRLRDLHGLALVAIDNAPWFTESAVPGQTEAGADALGRELHGLAASMAIPVIACCPVPWDVSKEEVEAPTQADLGRYAAILKHCAACLSIHYDLLGNGPTWEKELSVQIEFHPMNSRGDCSFHRFDPRSFRVRDWA